MRCVYCGKRLPLLKRWKDTEFCSGGHRELFQAATERAALERLVEAGGAYQSIRECLQPAASPGLLEELPLAAAPGPPVEVPELDEPVRASEPPEATPAPSFEELLERLDEAQTSLTPSRRPELLEIPASRHPRAATAAAPANEHPRAGFLDLKGSVTPHQFLLRRPAPSPALCARLHCLRIPGLGLFVLAEAATPRTEPYPAGRLAWPWVMGVAEPVSLRRERLWASAPLLLPALPELAAPRTEPYPAGPLAWPWAMGVAEPVSLRREPLWANAPVLPPAWPEPAGPAAPSSTPEPAGPVPIPWVTPESRPARPEVIVPQALTIPLRCVLPAWKVVFAARMRRLAEAGGRDCGWHADHADAGSQAWRPLPLWPEPARPLGPTPNLSLGDPGLPWAGVAVPAAADTLRLAWSRGSSVPPGARGFSTPECAGLRVPPRRLRVQGMPASAIPAQAAGGDRPAVATYASPRSGLGSMPALGKALWPHTPGAGVAFPVPALAGLVQLPFDPDLAGVAPVPLPGPPATPLIPVIGWEYGAGRSLTARPCALELRRGGATPIFGQLAEGVRLRTPRVRPGAPPSELRQPHREFAPRCGMRHASVLQPIVLAPKSYKVSTYPADQQEEGDLVSAISVPHAALSVVGSDTAPRLLPLNAGSSERGDLAPKGIQDSWFTPPHPLIPRHSPVVDAGSRKAGRFQPRPAAGTLSAAGRTWTNAPPDLKWISLLLPIVLIGILYSALPSARVERAGASAPAAPSVGSRFGVLGSALSDQANWFQKALSARAGVEFTDDFRSGLSEWQGRSDWARSWGYDAAGLVRPGQLALYKPTVRLGDYTLHFMGQIEKHSLSWVVRAQDLENYYVVRIVITRPGPLPLAGIVRYPVMNGREGPKTQLPLPLSVHNDTLYRVDMAMNGPHYTLSVQGQVVDSWSDNRYTSGGIGFFNAKGDQSLLRWVQVSYQYDTLGRLCAYLAPYQFDGGGDLKP